MKIRINYLPPVVTFRSQVSALFRYTNNLDNTCISQLYEYLDIFIGKIFFHFNPYAPKYLSNLEPTTVLVGNLHISTRFTKIASITQPAWFYNFRDLFRYNIHQQLHQLSSCYWRFNRFDNKCHPSIMSSVASFG